jgi:tetratricopeptide (TPR) repeat protein
MPEDPALDPRRSVEHVPSRETPSTVDDTGAHRLEGSTEPHVSAPPADAPSIPGYRITAEIARGGMGRVYAGHDLTLDREVAIKTLLRGADAERFVTEAKITARLPHPGIPPVHALGTLADGTPYLAMKLIRGHTLAELLQKRSSPLDRLPWFVQIFEQVAQAVGFAHAQGIIHRDLKPLNVMVGALGEVQVMDWGLAKHLATGEHKRPEQLPEDENVTQTAAGAILGTPGYMAPEQARGEVVDARADVFALGATLAVILTGQPALVGTSKRDMIEKAARADLADVHKRLTNSGADGELIALALSCLSVDVAQRPVDGRAVATVVAAYRAGVEARLKQAETERAEALVREAEQRKRRRTLQVGAGIIAVVLLAGLGVSLWQMFRAIDAEGQANQNAKLAREESDAKDVALKAEQQARQDETKARQQAFAALRSMTTDVVERKFAQGTVLTQDDRAFLRGVIAQYDAFAAIKSDDADSRALRAEGRWRVGNMRYRLGELKEAKQDYDQALSVYQQLTADFPSRPEFRHELARRHSNRGVLLEDTGRLQEAKQDYDQAISIHKQLVADFPSRPEFRQDLASSHNNRGVLLRDTGRRKEAEQDYEQALSIQKQLAADFPSRYEFRQDLARTHYNRGRLLRDTGRLKEAEKEWNEALSIQKQLAADFPSRPEFRQQLAQSHNNRGVLLRDSGRMQEAEKEWNEALSIQKQLAADFPSRPEFRKQLAMSHNNRGNLLFETGRPQEAEKEWNEAVSIQKQLAVDFPSRPEFRQELASSHNNRGVLLIRTGRLKEAEQDYEQALSIRKQLAADFPSRPEFRKQLATSHSNRGRLLRDMGRLKEAEKELGQALSIQKQLAADFPNQPDLRHDLGVTCDHLAHVQVRKGNWAAAKGLLLEGQPHHLAALKVSPRHPAYREGYHYHLNLLIEVHAGLLEQEDAVRTTETRRDLGWKPPDDAYNAACSLSLCVPIVAKHDKLDSQERQAAAQFYGDRAMKQLRDAVNKGYKDVAHMKKDTDLDPLRQRPDFQKLIAELEKAASASSTRAAHLLAGLRKAPTSDPIRVVCTWTVPPGAPAPCTWGYGMSIKPMYSHPSADMAAISSSVLLLLPLPKGTALNSHLADPGAAWAGARGRIAAVANPRASPQTSPTPTFAFMCMSPRQ